MDVTCAICMATMSDVTYRTWHKAGCKKRNEREAEAVEQFLNEMTELGEFDDGR